eukprot:TRINITY_DN14835_c0_g1_i1.p1 TRINITY_DN14835_c0_g1~~TRINITY_DN14835_c0_g1_i1.p1  ORF type:complete len:183 (+),score=45.06 TRINITY_DN14835_c0_g1_i1:34-549(+)
MKTEWYFARTHKTKQQFKFNSESSIWKMILNGEVDDALGFLQDKFMGNKMREFEETVWQEIEKLARKLLILADSCRYPKDAGEETKEEEEEKVESSDTRKKVDRGAYAAAVRSLEECKDSVSMQGLLYSFYDIETLAAAIQTIVALLKKNCSAKRLDTNKNLLNGIHFVEG